MVNFDLVIRVGSVNILVAVTTMAISSISCSFMDIVSILIRLRISIPMVLLFNMYMSRSISITMITRCSRPLVISVTISLDSLGTSVIVTDSTMSITMITWSSRPLVISITISLNSLGISVIVTNT